MHAILNRYILCTRYTVYRSVVLDYEHEPIVIVTSTTKSAICRHPRIGRPAGSNNTGSYGSPLALAGVKENMYVLYRYVPHVYGTIYTVAVYVFLQ